MDTIADMLTRIRNAQMAGAITVRIPFSKVKFELAKILKKESLIDSAAKEGKKPQEWIILNLRQENGQPVFYEWKRVSKPGQRIYLKNNKIRPVQQGYGLAIISTSQGLMTDQEARQKKLGGEILCKIY